MADAGLEAAGLESGAPRPRPGVGCNVRICCAQLLGAESFAIAPGGGRAAGGAAGSEERWHGGAARPEPGTPGPLRLHGARTPKTC